jgi:hypothetical protein
VHPGGRFVRPRPRRGASNHTLYRRVCPRRSRGDRLPPESLPQNACQQKEGCMRIVQGSDQVRKRRKQTRGDEKPQACVSARGTPKGNSGALAALAVSVMEPKNAFETTLGRRAVVCTESSCGYQKDRSDGAQFVPTCCCGAALSPLHDARVGWPHGWLDAKSAPWCCRQSLWRRMRGTMGAGF